MSILAKTKPYTLPVERGDWPQLLADWRTLVPNNFTPWILTRFGELFMRQPDERIGMLQVSNFRYSVVAENATDFAEWLSDKDKMAEWFLAPLVRQLERSGRILAADQCYSFITPLGLGGELNEKNVMLIPIHEHFGLWGEVYDQIKDMPDGGTVVLRIKDR